MDPWRRVLRFIAMTTTWTIIVAWLALQLPLGMLVGRCTKLGEAADENTIWLGSNSSSLRRRYAKHRLAISLRAQSSVSASHLVASI
jgi:hypothetical protein